LPINLINTVSELPWLC